jgi:hypothetical protein
MTNVARRIEIHEADLHALLKLKSMQSRCLSSIICHSQKASWKASRPSSSTFLSTWVMVKFIAKLPLNQPTEKPASKKKPEAKKDEFVDCLEVESEDTLQDFQATPVASYLRNTLVDLSNSPKAVAKAEKSNAPLAVALLVGHITKQIHHLKKSADELPSSDTFLDAYAKY